MRTVLVTGSNRGLGLEFVRQLLARGDRVIAACRQPETAAALQSLRQAGPDRLGILPLELADPDAIAAFARDLASRTGALDLLVNNAGMTVRGERFGTVTAEAMTAALRTNAVGPFLLAQALAPLLAKGSSPVVVNISSQLGSIARTDSFYTPSYATSKAALNMAGVLLAHGFAPSGVKVVMLHPGWVRTDMGGAGAPLEAPEAVAGMLQVISGLKPEDSGRFMDYQGHSMPW